MTEVIRAAGVATLACHLIQAAGAQRGITRERVLDERNIRIDHRRTRTLSRDRNASLSEHTTDRGVVYAELARQCADRPALGVMEPQDLRLELARDHHCHDP